MWTFSNFLLQIFEEFKILKDIKTADIKDYISKADDLLQHIAEMNKITDDDKVRFPFFKYNYI